MNHSSSGRSEYILEMRHISKAFPGVQALDDVTFKVLAGEVHALVGENGAGKSTLMKILSGAYRRDAGKVFIEGQRVEIPDPITAQRLGISMIYQELNLVPPLTVAENIFLGRLSYFGGGARLRWREIFSQADEQLARVNADVGSKVKVDQLSVAEQQMVEITKALSMEAKVIVMDEPTSALTRAETENLFDIIARLKKEGVAVVFISHRLEEVSAIADRVTVLRDGRRIDTRPLSDLDRQTIVSMMVGRELTALFPKFDVQIGDPVLEVRSLSRDGVLKDINLEVRKGEIVGLAGLVGAGRTDLAKTIFGIKPPESGQILVEGTACCIASPWEAISLGLGLVPEDRKGEALILARPVRDNITIATIKDLSRLGFSIQHRREDELVEDYIQRLDIKTPGPLQQVRNLSGGNQQKTVVARWLAARPKVLIMDEPTRGIDVGAKAEIHELMGKMVQEGVGILMISSEMPEILGVSDRIVVMFEGRITGEFTREEATQELIMEAATGGDSQ